MVEADEPRSRISHLFSCYRASFEGQETRQERQGRMKKRRTADDDNTERLLQRLLVAAMDHGRSTTRTIWESSTKLAPMMEYGAV